MGPDLLGDPLPHSVLGWIVLLAAILGGLRAVLSAAQEFAEFLGIHREIERPYGGLALPIGWASWCVILLIGRHDVATVLVCLIGTLTITVTATLFRRRCKA